MEISKWLLKLLLPAIKEVRAVKEDQVREDQAQVREARVLQNLQRTTTMTTYSTDGA